MTDNLQLIISTVSDTQADDIKAYYQANGFVETILHLVNDVWNKETLDNCKAAIDNGDTESPLYDLMFIRFQIQRHFEITNSHRAWVVKSFERLREFVPNMTEEDANKHDLSKYDFVQAVGYTAKWVHDVAWGNSTWQAALQDHYRRESHHPQFFEKTQRMTRKDLEESLVDMVACRWERDLNGDEGVSLFDLVNFEEKFLKRYVKDDFDDVIALIKDIQTKSGQ
ncbi:uncharacterized protein [Argopecten irradians]|uniref:uncharacterized protein n=1 Tax=Argopecten irradians TaxID=31199 RepID=UPI003719EE9F